MIPVYLRFNFLDTGLYAHVFRYSFNTGITYTDMCLHS